MLRTQRIRGLRACGSRAASSAILLLAVMAGGCSADLARFDFPSSNYGPDGRSTAALQPTPSEPLRRSNAGAPLGDDIDNPRPWDRGEPSSRGSVYGSEALGRDYRPDDRSSYRGPSQSQDTRMAALPSAAPSCCALNCPETSLTTSRIKLSETKKTRTQKSSLKS